jgi:hypothetical protein
MSEHPPLWQVVLDWLADDEPISVLYPYDEVAVLHRLKDLAALGEHPSMDEFRNYFRARQDHWGESERKVCEAWKKLLRNPGHRFKALHRYEYQDQPFYTVEWLIEQHGLAPGLRERISAVAHSRLDALIAAADQGTRAEYEEAQRLFALSRHSIAHLRRARFGGPFDDT